MAARGLAVLGLAAIVHLGTGSSAFSQASMTDCGKSLAVTVSPV